MKAWAKGDRVAQPTYGAGTLVEVNEHHTVIDFDEGGRRVFATRLVALQTTNEPAPAKAARKRAAKAKPKDAASKDAATKDVAGKGAATKGVATKGAATKEPKTKAAKA